MKTTHLFLGIIILLAVSSCNRAYVAPDFNQKTESHRKVAILPFEMIYTGVRPDNLTDDNIREIEHAESEAFQISFSNALFQSTRGSRKQIKITLQDQKETLRILKNNDIDIYAAWEQRPEKLAAILEVDAVVRARIQKHRYMTDMESFGIDLGIHILDAIGGSDDWPWLPVGITNSKEIKADYKLINADDATVLWSISFEQGVDWSRRSNEVIDEVNRRASRKFPYRL